MGSVKLLGILNSAGNFIGVYYACDICNYSSFMWLYTHLSLWHIASSVAYKNAHVPIIFIVGIVQMRKGSMRVALLVQLYHHLITVYLNLNISSCQRGVV